MNVRRTMKLVFIQGNEKTAVVNFEGFDKKEIIEKMKSIGWQLKVPETKLMRSKNKGDNDAT